MSESLGIEAQVRVYNYFIPYPRCKCGGERSFNRLHKTYQCESCGNITLDKKGKKGLFDGMV